MVPVRQIQQNKLHWLLVVIMCVCASTSTLAYEEDIVLEVPEKHVREEARFPYAILPGLSFGYGISRGSELLFARALDPTLQEYLNRLGLEYSENPFYARLRLTVLLTPRIGIYAAVPYGVTMVRETETRNMEIFGAEPEFTINTIGTEHGFGDFYGGVYWNCLPEGKYWPGVVLDASVNGDNSEYYALGDGFISYTLATGLRKSLCTWLYVSANTAYTERDSKEGIDPGNIQTYGGGIGLGKPSKGIEFTVRQIEVDETYMDNALLFEEDDSITAGVVWHDGPGSSVSIMVANVDEGLHFDDNTYRIEWRFGF